MLIQVFNYFCGFLSTLVKNDISVYLFYIQKTFGRSEAISKYYMVILFSPQFRLFNILESLVLDTLRLSLVNLLFEHISICYISALLMNSYSVSSLFTLSSK